MQLLKNFKTANETTYASTKFNMFAYHESQTQQTIYINVFPISPFNRGAKADKMPSVAFTQRVSVEFSVVLLIVGKAASPWARVVIIPFPFN